MDMQPWARRIHDLLIAQDKKPADLARACKIKAGSVSGWFGKGKPTKMISGDNLVAAAAYLGTSAEAIMTGRVSGGGVAVQSQSVGLDEDKLATVLKVVEGAIRDSRRQVPPRFKASMIRRVYESQHALTAETADAVQAAVASLFDTLDA